MCNTAYDKTPRKRLVVRTIDPLACVLVQVRESDLKNRHYLKTLQFTERSQIKGFEQILKDTSIFEERKDQDKDGLDARINIEYYINNKVVAVFYWEKTGVFKINNKYYNYNIDIDYFLYKNGLLPVLLPHNKYIPIDSLNIDSILFFDKKEEHIDKEK